MSDKETENNGDLSFSLCFTESEYGRQQREARVAKRIHDGACPKCLQFKSEWKAKPQDRKQEEIEQHNVERPLFGEEMVKYFIDGLHAPRYVGDCSECGAPLWQAGVM
jgi:hypothetical protein